MQSRRSGDQDNPLVPLHLKMRPFDRDLIRGGHYGQRSCEPRKQAEHIGVGDRSCFKNGRQFAAWLGLVPKQRSSGGRHRLFGISKRGDRYLRTLMIHAARAALGKAGGKQDPRSRWLGKLRQLRHPNIAAVALANKNTRIAWALLANGEAYDPGLAVGSA